MKQIIYLLLFPAILYSCADNKKKKAEETIGREMEAASETVGRESIDSISLNEIAKPAMYKNSEGKNSAYLEATKEMVNYSTKVSKNIALSSFDNSFIYKKELDEKIEDISNEIYLFGSKTKKINKTTSVKFNIPENCNRISGKSWRCCGKVIVNWNGTMSSQIHTSSNRLQGFTGAIRIIFYDSNENAIYEVHTPSYGINGESSRWSSWNAQLDDWVVQTSQYAYAEGIHTSSNRTLYYIYDLGKQYIQSQGGGGFQF